jgi:hypothetical protein
MSAATPTATPSPPPTAPPHCPPPPGAPSGAASIPRKPATEPGALYTIAITQIRGDTEGRAYYAQMSRRQNQTRSPALLEAGTVRHRVHHHASGRRPPKGAARAAAFAEPGQGGCGRCKRGTNHCLTASCVADLPASTMLFAAAIKPHPPGESVLRLVSLRSVASQPITLAS